MTAQHGVSRGRATSVQKQNGNGPTGRASMVATTGIVILKLRTQTYCASRRQEFLNQGRFEVVEEPGTLEGNINEGQMYCLAQRYRKMQIED